MLMLFTPKKIAVAVFLALSVSHVMAEEKKSAADSATPETLGEVEVKAAVDKDALAKPYAGGQVAKGGSLGVLGNQNVMDVPFSTVNYTSELIQNQQARSVADVVVNDASVRALTAPGGFGDQFQIRGYTVGNEDTGLNGLFGLTSTTRVPLEMVERVQVLKGPGTFVNGIPPSGSIGGSVNLVTKRAGNEPLTRLTTSYLGESQFAAHIDAGRRFGQNNEWGVRVNALKRSGEGTIDKGSQQTGLASLGLDYLGEKLRWSLDVIVQGDDIREFRPQASIADSLTRIPSAPDARKNFYPGTKLDYNGKTYMSNLEYDVNSNVTLYGGVGYTDFAFSQTFPSAENGIRAGGDFTLRNAYYDYYSKTFVSNAGARFKFATGNVGHTMTLAANRLSQENGYFYNFSLGTATSNIYNPVALPSIAGTRNSPTRNIENVLTSYVLTDTLSFLDEKVLLTLGVRDQTVEQRTYDLTTGAKTDTYDKGAVSPLAGIVVKPLDNVALYANHTKGLTQGELVPVGAGFSNGGTALAPYKSTQNEVGVKVDFGRITTVVSVFQIERPNREDDPVTNRRSYSGEQRNRGLELAAYGEIASGLRMMASTTFTDPKVKSNSATSDGKDAIGVPDFTANLGLDWDTPWVDGLSFNGRAIGTSSAYYNSANTVSVPGWTRLDIGARYTTKAAGKPIVLRANLENLLDKNYWLQSGTFLTIAAPRTLLLSATIDF
jgi:iron complex outermembrane recepter protein